MLIACQLRLSTSTIDLFSMSVIKFDAKVFILCWCLRTAAENWLPRLALLQGACARPPPVSETGALLIMQRGNGRLRNLQKRKTRGDSHCYFQDTSASGLSTQNTKYGVFASRRCMRIRKGLSKIILCFVTGASCFAHPNAMCASDLSSTPFSFISNTVFCTALTRTRS